MNLMRIRLLQNVILKLFKIIKKSKKTFRKQFRHEWDQLELLCFLNNTFLTISSTILKNQSLSLSEIFSNLKLNARLMSSRCVIHKPQCGDNPIIKATRPVLNTQYKVSFVKASNSKVNDYDKWKHHMVIWSVVNSLWT